MHVDERALEAAVARLTARGFPIGDLFIGAEISADAATRSLIVAIVDARRMMGVAPEDLAVGCALQHDGVPVESIYGIPLVFDETVPAGAVEVRGPNGSRLVEGFYTPTRKAAA